MIGHRGASGYRPEHTIAAYRLAIDMGADFIEPDLVSTKDRVLVARHENEISGTTDVARHPEFADRRTTKSIDGSPITGWFTEDFTLAELKTLRAIERVPEVRPENTAFNGQEQIPTFDEVIALAQSRGVGVYPETKHPTYFDGIGLSLEEPLLASLRSAGLTKKKHAVFIQSFETANLRELNGLTDVRLAELTLHAWTFRNENTFLPLDFRAGNPAAPGYTGVTGDAPAEYRLFFGLGLDGLFSDNPDTAVASRAGLSR